MTFLSELINVLVLLIIEIDFGLAITNMQFLNLLHVISFPFKVKSYLSIFLCHQYFYAVNTFWITIDFSSLSYIFCRWCHFVGSYQLLENAQPLLEKGTCMAYLAKKGRIVKGKYSMKLTLKDHVHYFINKKEEGDLPLKKVWNLSNQSKRTPAKPFSRFFAFANAQ